MANISSLIAPNLKPTPDIIIHGTETVAPAAATVLADTGALLAAGKLMIVANWGGDDNVATVEVAHRNAANSADLEVDYPGVPAGASSYVTWFSLAVGERIVVRNKVAGTAAKTYQAAIFGWVLP